MESADRKLLARASPAGFAWWASGERWVPAEHLLLLSELLVAVAAGRVKRLMVFMPPRHGKSELISRYMPAWYLGRFPDRKVMLCSYADTFAASWGRKARDTFKESCPSLFGVRVNEETAGGGQWEVHKRDGIMVTAGVGGGITGKGADLLIIDDPVKNAQDASSQTIQELQHDWWKSTARTRLMPGAGVVLVMTRWHEADLAGRLIGDWIDGDGDEWKVLSLPGLAEPVCSVSYTGARSMLLGPDPLGRAEGEALWPSMPVKLPSGKTEITPVFPVSELEATRSAMGGRWFNAMYQQRPSASEGNFFKRANFRYYTRDDAGLITMARDEGPLLIDPAYCLKFQTIDAAESEKKSADYTVVSTWLVTPSKDLIWLDCERAKLEGPDVKSMVRRSFYVHSPQIVGIEKKSAGTGVFQELIREGLPVVPLDADLDKVARAAPAAARFEEKRVYLPAESQWREAAEAELLNFPNAQHDDIVDTVAYAGRQLPLLSSGGAVRGIVDRTRGRSSTGGTLLGDVLSRTL